MPAEWERFKIDVGTELTTVRHVVHLPFACRIVEDGRIKAGLVYDESWLNKSRISVAWVSANTWGLGSIYGTVEFQFAWADLVKDQKIYWVEAMNYRPNAYRLLLSKRDLQPGLIQPYDPAKDKGPLRLRDDKYFWNYNFTSEFMIEDDLSLDRCTSIDFVPHHSQYCRPFGQGCSDRQNQPSPAQTGGKMLSFILAKGLHVLDHHLKPPGETGFIWLDSAYQGIHWYLLPPEMKFAGAIREDAICRNVLHGALALYSIDQLDQARNVLSLIPSKEKFTQVLKEIIRTHFGDLEWEPSRF
jgi:hypothetical protein